jgi:predicted ribosome quality control (RQC) complex YloA/Tae2 family protein
LTDHEYRILALLRVVAPEENARFAVGEIYPFQLAQQFTPLSMDTLSSLLVASGPKDNLKKYLGAKLDHSSAMVEHCLLEAGLDPSTKCSSLKRGQGLDEDSVQKIYDALLAGDHMVMEAANNGITSLQQY